MLIKWWITVVPFSDTRDPTFEGPIKLMAVVTDESGNRAGVAWTAIGGGGRTPEDSLDELIENSGDWVLPLGEFKAPMESVIGDLNGDSRLDAAIVNRASSDVSVYLAASGDAVASPVDFAVGPNPVRLELGDFNGDSVPDMVTANSHEDADGPASLSVLIGEGNGTFQNAVSFLLGNALSAFDVVVGDFDADGSQDLAAAVSYDDDSESLMVLLGNGDGSFQDAVPLSAPNGVRSLAVASINVDQDDHDDLITTGSVMLSNGDGTFQPGSPYLEDFNLAVVQTGDVNGDAKPDIVAANTNHVISVLVSRGNGAFEKPRHYAIGRFPEAIHIADYDYDAAADIYVASTAGSPALFLLGNGDGTFKGADVYPTVSRLDRQSGATSAAVADFTGDGVPDLVVANDGNLQGAVDSPSFNGQTALVLPGFGDGRLGEPIEIPEQPGTQVVAGDWDGDANADLALVGGGPRSPKLYLVRGHGDGTFTSYDQIDLPGESVDRFESSLTTAQLDGENSFDLLIGHPREGMVSVFLGADEGDFVEKPFVHVGEGRIDLGTGDFNEDGMIDLVASHVGGTDALNGSIKFLSGAGDGTFTAPSIIRENLRPDSVAVADINRDGHLDLAVSAEITPFNRDVEIFLGNGDGTFEEPVSLGLTESSINGVVLADGDRDGIPDLGVSIGADRLLGLRGRGDGTFEPVLHGKIAGRNVIGADLNLDGWTDMVSASESGFVVVQMNTLKELGILLPILQLARNNSLLELSWVANRDFGLMESLNLVDWFPSARPIQIVDERSTVEVSDLQESRYFRLEATE